MADGKLARALSHILTAVRDDRSVSDRELLQRFTVQHDEAAFELLVWRYQRLVLGICRRVLHNLEDEEDVFQTTFLILARKASSVSRQEAIGSWLYQVATRAAIAARTARSKRIVQEGSTRRSEAAAFAELESSAEGQELWSFLDEEISRLPERFRVAVILCYLEGKTLDEAARQLGCPRGTVASRLARARQRLRLRLTRRGLQPTAGLLAAGLSQAGVAGGMANELIRRTGQAVASLTAGAPVSGPALSNKIFALSEEVLKAMLIRKVTTGAATLVVGVLVLGVALVMRTQVGEGAEPAPVPAAAAPTKTSDERLASVTVVLPVRREVVPFEDFTGRLIAAGPGVPRVAVAMTNPIAVRFDIDERSYLHYQRLRSAGEVKGEGEPLAVGLSDENNFPRKGMLARFESEFDKATGTIGVHGVLSNADKLLLPGMFVRVRMPFGAPRSMLEVPEEAIGKEQGQSFVWVVADRNIVERRIVRVGPVDGNLRIIEDGLSPESRIVVTGIKGLKPGDQVESQARDQPLKQEK